MKRLKRKRKVILTAVLLLFISAYLLYSRPMTIQKRYPILNLEKCTQLYGYYKLDGQLELTQFVIDKNNEEFGILCDLLYEQDYYRSLRNLLPEGTRIFSKEPGAFQWQVYFVFEDIVFPDGSIGSGEKLSIHSCYGELDIYFDGKQFSCYTNKQEDWAKVVFEIIQ